MKRILLYGPYNGRARDIESVAEALTQKGHDVFFLTQQQGLDILPVLNKAGVHAKSTGITSRWFPVKWLRELFFIIAFCRKHSIDVLFSHLEPAHIVTVIAQFFIPARVIICRHHVDEIELIGGHRNFSYRMIYRLGKEFLVVSERTRQYMIEKENIAADKIRVINLLFDFRKFATPDPTEVTAIRTRTNARLVLLTACRLVKFKRPGLSIDVLKGVRAQGVDAHLIILGHGELAKSLEEEVAKSGLAAHCTLTGFKANVIDYLEACDILLHPSILDSSGMILKEAGLRKKIVIGCDGIGLLDDKLIDRVNGFVVDKDRFVEESVSIILNYDQNKDQFAAMGATLHQDVLEHFSIEKKIREYDFIN